MDALWLSSFFLLVFMAVCVGGYYLGKRSAYKKFAHDITLGKAAYHGDAPQETFTEYEHRQIVQENAAYQTELQNAAITIADLQKELTDARADVTALVGDRDELQERVNKKELTPAPVEYTSLGVYDPSKTYTSLGVLPAPDEIQTSLGVVKKELTPEDVQDEKLLTPAPAKRPRAKRVNKKVVA